MSEVDMRLRFQVNRFCSEAARRNRDTVWERLGRFGKTDRR